ncbi:MAG: GNAT family N-acetyltransferase [Dehalococcoidia bacterium]
MRGELMLPIETDRLLLRDFVESDFGAIHAYASDAEVVRFKFWGPRTPADTRDYLDQMLATQRHQSRMTYEVAVVRCADGRLIGACDINLQRERQADIGYVFAKDVWGQGYGTECATALIAAGFTQLNLHRIYATCDPRNTGSFRVMEKAGMRREGILRDSVWAKDRWWDVLYCSILEDEWRAAQPGPPLLPTAYCPF